MFRKGVFRAVNDSEIFAAPAFDARLNDPPAAFFDKAQRFDNHAFSATSGVFDPPGDGALLTLGVNQIDVAMLGGEEQRRIGATKRSESFHVPDMVPVKVNLAFGCE